MSRYETYKPSGIDWIGDVPVHWEVKRLKNLATNVSSKSTEILDEDFIVALENIESNTGKFIESSSEYENNGIIFKKSHLLYNKLRPYLNKVFLAKRDGICVGDIIVVECSKKLQPKFLQYKMLSDAFCSIVMSSVQGTKMPRTSWEFISSLKFGIPSIDEQRTIANYLDHQTQKIDSLIANKKAQAEKLKEMRQIEINNAVIKGLNPNAEMKDSGIDWLGEIPKHWEVKRLKNILVEKMMYGANEIADEDDEQNPRYIRITDFGSNGELRDDTFKSLPFEIAQGYLLQEGDILFARSGATVGKTFQFRNYKGVACFAGYLIKARPNFNILTSDFLFFFTQSNGYENWKNSIFSKATIENIGADKYQLLKLCVPPTIDEQNSITEYLQERTTSIDKLIKNIESQIEKLQELRKIKIYEAVTGKIKVNVYAEATA